MHNTACSLREIKRNVINFWLVWSKFEEEANKSMSGLRLHKPGWQERGGVVVALCASTWGQSIHSTPSCCVFTRLMVYTSQSSWVSRSIILSIHDFLLLFIFCIVGHEYCPLHLHASAFSSNIMLRLNDLYAWGGSRPWSMNGWQWQSAKQHGPARADDATNQTSV